MRERESSRHGRERAFHRTTQRNENHPVTRTSYRSSGSFEDIKARLEETTILDDERKERNVHADAPVGVDGRREIREAIEIHEGGTCQLVPGDTTLMDVQAGGGLELYQPESIANGAANTCIGLRNGKACVFPITYLGQTFNGCTLFDDVNFWCSPVADYIAGTFMYEHCPFSCPINNPCC
ncbi:unnamed protein product [Darwinula stevensoni]|uniref:Fibronectin type-II domain-containing protein n=1 Tax=Darwinula stevensoni TaxID=69355 RepID=A0A7R9AGF4_9CRUS|nr:unnamed protein product [Darwinula stevensoni]CAG0903615.1 unnamed protein product [Darwinula stevensoni]